MAKAQFAYNVTNGTITITGYSGAGGAVTIPAMVNGLLVTCIGDYAFYGRTSLTSVTIPSSVNRIGAEAFHDCTGLTSVTIPNSVTNIGSWAFYYCTNLTNITIPSSVTGIGDGVFEDCRSLASVTIPSSITGIGQDAFAVCSALTGVYFQGDAPTVDSTAFNGDNYSTIYQLPGTTGWGPFFANRPTALWNVQTQTSRASLGARTNGFGFTITGASNLAVVVEACTNLANPSWSPLHTMTLTGEPAQFADPQWSNYPARFYRLHWP